MVRCLLSKTLAQRVPLQVYAPPSIKERFNRLKGQLTFNIISPYAMTLQTRSPAFHNQMLGQRIRHPSSTKFDEDFETPIAKRLKRLDSTDSSLSRREDSEAEDEEERIPTPQGPTRRTAREIPDSEAESDDDDSIPTSSRKTDLETALPPVRTDKEAIAEYEATRAAEAVDLDLQGRLGQRKWVQGKSSIYVDAFNLALETVLEDESHLFNEAEMSVFEQWRGLSYEGQYL